MTTGRPVVREIITKAVCGRGTYKYQRSIDLEVPVGRKPIQVLGNFVSNASLLEAIVADRYRDGKAVQVKGKYDLHVWYAYDQDTQAAKTTVTFIEYIPIQTYGGESLSNQQAYAEFIQKPVCRKAYVKSLGDKSVIRVEVEQELASEIIGLTKIKVGLGAKIHSSDISGQELIPPPKHTTAFTGPTPDRYLDLKCGEDLPEEDDDEDYSEF